MTKAGFGRVLAITGALVLLLGACGDDDDDGGNGGGDALSEDEFVEQAGEICTDASGDIAEALGDIQDVEDDGFPDAAEEAQGVIEDGAEELEDLNPPSEIEDDVEDLISALREQAELLGDAASAADDGDTDEAEQLVDEDIADLDEEVRGLTDDIGIDCSGGGDATDSTDSTDSTDATDGGGTSAGVSRPVCDEVDSGDEIEVGDTVDGTIEDDGDTAAYELAGDGSTVDIAVDQADDSFDPVLTICGSDGEELDDDDDGGGFPNAAIEGFEAEDGEDYLIVVFGFGGSTGDFELAVS